MLKGLLQAPGIVSNKECIANTKNAIENWNLGPMVMDSEDKPYWQKMAKIFNITEAEARTQICGNCEYYENTPRC